MKNISRNFMIPKPCQTKNCLCRSKPQMGLIDWTARAEKWIHSVWTHKTNLKWYEQRVTVFREKWIEKNIALWSYYTLTLCPLIFHHMKACFVGYPEDHQYQDEQEHLWPASSFSLRFWCHISAAKKRRDTKRENKIKQSKNS